MTWASGAPYKWPLGVDIPLVLTISEVDGSASTGKSPEVAIRRLVDSGGGVLDLQYWDGATFTAVETWLAMTEVSDGAYRYLFDAPLVEQGYLVHFRHASDPVGIDTEIHIITSDVNPSVGARTVTVTVEDQDSDPVPGCVVDVYDSTGTLHLFRARDNDLDGVIAFNVDDGTYVLKPFALRWVPDAATTTQVVDGDETVTLTGELTEAASDPDPTLCNVWGFILDASGNPINDVTLDFYADAPLGVGSGVFALNKLSVVSGDGAWADGYFEIPLVRESKVRIRSTLAKLDNLVVDVPDAGTAELSDLVEAAK